MADRLGAARAYVMQRPTDRFGLYTLAMELRKVQAWEECFSTFDKLLTLYPDNGPGYYHYAMAQKESDNREQALRLIERGLAATEGKDPKTYRELDDLQNALMADDE